MIQDCYGKLEKQLYFQYFYDENRIIMPVNYVSDNTGSTIAVQIPSEEWMGIKNKYPDVDNLNGELPDWQKQLIDQRLQAIASDPNRLHPIEELLEELDQRIIEEL